jgi:methionine-rich copper-binding protein CopC
MDVVPKLLLPVLAAVLLVVVGSSPADAHASLVSTNPEDGSRVATAPPSVELTFSEEIGEAFVAVAAPDGAEVKTSPAHVSGARVHADLATSEERGRFTVAYRVVSADGHPVSGTFTFTTTTGRIVEQQDAPASEPFVERHGTVLVIGLAVAVLAIGLILNPLTRQRRQ